jgi:hypothetical protein
LQFRKEDKEFDLLLEVRKFITGCMQHSEKVRGLIFNVLFILLYQIYLVLHEINLSPSVCLSAWFTATTF